MLVVIWTRKRTFTCSHRTSILHLSLTHTIYAHINKFWFIFIVLSLSLNLSFLLRQSKWGPVRACSLYWWTRKRTFTGSHCTSILHLFSSSRRAGIKAFTGNASCNLNKEAHIHRFTSRINSEFFFLFSFSHTYTIYAHINSDLFLLFSLSLSQSLFPLKAI